ncbi:hypothetical protein HanRHA438_Chr03g0118271 [Helianthus annuus]|nr:hypothetical protein HanRHA438_Chr03g0118271 [Helianthus annuus]
MMFQVFRSISIRRTCFVVLRCHLNYFHVGFVFGCNVSGMCYKYQRYPVFLQERALSKSCEHYVMLLC